jgi:hypothetical protein
MSNAAKENNAMIKPLVYPLKSAQIKMTTQIISSTTVYFFSVSTIKTIILKQL